MALVLFGATLGRPTLDQANEFALLWSEQRFDVRYGYIDAISNEDTRRALDVRRLPTTILFQDGVPVHRFRGLHHRFRLESVIQSRAQAESSLALAA
jgi:thioredoxin-like negative regulator of GroEL